MSYNGSGTFQINTSGQPVVTGTIISSTAFNSLTADLATGLSTAITKDGQTATTVRIPFAQGINSTLATDSTSTSTGSIITAGGVGITKALFVGQGINSSLVTDSTSTGTGSIITAGGVGIAKALYVGTTSNFAGASTFGAAVTFNSTIAYGGVTLTAAVTGTGKMVLDTSPTLVTPILGTPTSGNLINCTGINYDGYKNRLINGQMQVAQRATSATVTAGTTVPTASTGYPCVDRFFVYSVGANVTAAQVAGSGAIKNNLQITGAASVTSIGVGQRIEQLNSYDLAGSTATLSVNISNSLLTTVTWTASYATTANTFGTIGTPTKTQIATGTFTVTSTLTNYSTQISVPAAATTGIEILFTVGAQTSGTWVIGNAQLEKSSIATTFDYRPYGTELALCQRYYCTFVVGFRWFAGSSSIPISTIFSYPLTMRAVPTVTQGAVISSANISTASFSTAYSTGAIFQATAATTGDSSRYDNATASAEL